jgi:hypothetical protein
MAPSWCIAGAIGYAVFNFHNAKLHSYLRIETTTFSRASLMSSAVVVVLGQALRVYLTTCPCCWW